MIIRIAILLLSLQCSLIAGEKCGKIVKSSGNYYINEEPIVSSKKTILFNKDRILIKKKIILDIILKDRTAIRMYGPCELSIIHIRKKERDLPSYIKVKYGSYRIIQQNRYIDHSLTILTGNSILKTVCASFDFISSIQSDIVLVKKKELGIANIHIKTNTALIVKPGYEVIVYKKDTPAIKNYIKLHQRKVWLSNYFLSRDLNNISQYKLHDGLIEWMLTPAK